MRGGDFIAWANRYIRLPCEQQVTGEELYSARCGLLHTSGVESRKTRSGQCRMVGYFHGRVPEFGPRIDPSLVMVSVEALKEAFFKGVDDFLIASIVSAAGAEPAVAGASAGSLLKVQAEWRQCKSARRVFGRPYRPVPVLAGWRTATAVARARGIYSHRAFDVMPILGDALQDAGCASVEILGRCYGPGPTSAGAGCSTACRGSNPSDLRVSTPPQVQVLLLFGWGEGAFLSSATAPAFESGVPPIRLPG